MSKTGSGPPPKAPPDSSPPPTPTPPDDALSAALDEPILTNMDSGVDQLLSTAVPDSLSDPLNSVEVGWTIGLQEADPYTNETAASGTPDPFVGRAVDAYTAMPSGANINPYTDSQDVNPFTGLQDAAFTSAGGEPDTSQPGSSGLEEAASSAKQWSSELEDYWKTASSAERSQWLASNLAMNTGTSVMNSDHGFPDQVPSNAIDSSTTATPPIQASITVIQSIPETSIVGVPTNRDLSLNTAIQEAVGSTVPTLSPIDQPGNISDVLSGTNWMSSLNPQVSSPQLLNNNQPSAVSGAEIPFYRPPQEGDFITMIAYHDTGNNILNYGVNWYYGLANLSAGLLNLPGELLAAASHAARSIGFNEFEIDAAQKFDPLAAGVTEMRVLPGALELAAEALGSLPSELGAFMADRRGSISETQWWTPEATSVFDRGTVRAANDVTPALRLPLVDTHFTQEMTSITPAGAFQGLTDKVAERLRSNPQRVGDLHLLSASEQRLSSYGPWAQRITFGNAVERGMARAADRSGFLVHTGDNRPMLLGGPDFVGAAGTPYAGLNFQVTTPGQYMRDHLANSAVGTIFGLHWGPF